MKEAPVPEPLRMNLPIQTATIRPGVKCIRNMGGDLPPLLSDKGTAWMMVYTTRFFPEEVVGKTVVIHDMPDDFRTQPSGNSGEKIACGQIVAEDPDIR